jgi:hypothetical protein
VFLLEPQPAAKTSRMKIKMRFILLSVGAWASS